MSSARIIFPSLKKWPPPVIISEHAAIERERLLASCATANKALNCAGWRPIHPSRHDVLTRQTKEMIVSHNEFGVHQKCWAKP